CAANYLRSRQPRANPLPNYIGVNPIVNYDSFRIAGPTYVGAAYAPFAVMGDPSRPDFEVPGVGLTDRAQLDRLNDRAALSRNLDRLERAMDSSGEMRAIDQFESQAMTLLTNRQTR